MSIFNEDIRHPDEFLYEDLKQICNEEVFAHMTHYLGQPEYVQTAIVDKLKEKNLFRSYREFIYTEDSIGKISQVLCFVAKFEMGTPIYRVIFYRWVKDPKDNYFGDGHTQFFTEFYVAFYGVVNVNELI